VNASLPADGTRQWILRFQGVSHHYAGAQHDSPSVQDVDLSLHSGETLCVVGESGSGKSTLLRLVNGLERASAGEVSVRERDVAEWDELRLRRSMGYVLQSGGLFPHLNTAQNIALRCELEGWEPARTSARVRELLLAMGLDPEAHGKRYPVQLSGGQRQRVGIARALALDPDLLLMDEPFGALDPLTRRRLQSWFLAWQAAERRSVMFITHDLDEAFRLGDRIAVMRAGRIEQVASGPELLERPATEYVGQLLKEFGRGN